MTASIALQSVNPASEEIIRDYDEIDDRTLNQILTVVDQSFEKWRRTTFNERAEKLQNAAGILRNNADEYGRMMAVEMGKPLSQGKAEAEKCAWVCDYYAENGAQFLKDTHISTDARKSYVNCAPLGVVFAIMPWNFPFWQVFRCAVPAVMAGNAVVLKHSENVCGCALAIEKIFLEAGFPDNQFRTILITRHTAAQVIDHPAVKGVALTGSVAAGKKVAARAGSVLKKTVMEMGGSDPYIILEDADVDDAAEKCVTSRLLNSGQTCISAKRFIVVESVYDAFVGRFVDLMQSKTMDDPFLDPDIGPQAKPDLRDKLHGQVLQSLEQGARLLTGGEIPDTKGCFYPPTVLENVVSGMPVFDEETFGPVAAMIRVKNETEAVALANKSAYGLGAAVFSQNLEKAEIIARQHLETGNVFINDFVKSDPRLPFGGIKNSGYGRELSVAGIQEFINMKTIVIG